MVETCLTGCLQFILYNLFIYLFSEIRPHRLMGSDKTHAHQRFSGCLKYTLLKHLVASNGALVWFWKKFSCFGKCCISVELIQHLNADTYRPLSMRGIWKDSTACFCRTTNRMGLSKPCDDTSTDTRTPSVWNPSAGIKDDITLDNIWF